MCAQEDYHVKKQQEDGLFKPQREASEEVIPTDTWTLDLRTPEQ